VETFLLIRIGFGNVDEPAAARLISLFADSSDHCYVSYFTSPERAKSSLLGRVLLRSLLSEATDTTPSSWILPSNGHTGPRIARSSETGEYVFVSVSRSDQLVVAAMCKSGQVGIDTENPNKKRNFDRILYHLLGSRTKPGGTTQPEFYRLWTLHEAYCKSTGRGLGFPISEPVRQAFKNSQTGDLYAIRFEGRCYQFLTGNLANNSVAVCLLKNKNYELNVMR
jgi:phosphopantetheinyl transferase